MWIGWRIGIFVAPVLLAVILKYTIVAAQDGEELALISKRPAKVFDLSLDFLLVAFSILLGMLLYTQNAGAFTIPGSTKQITARDVLICAVVQFVAIVFIFAFVLAAPHLPGWPQQHLDFVTIWLPDLLGLAALIWVVFKLT
jgi:hypothetical protein